MELTSGGDSKTGRVEKCILGLSSVSQIELSGWSNK